MGALGHEQFPKTAEKQQISKERGTNSGTPDARTTPGGPGTGRGDNSEVIARIVAGLPRLTAAKLRAVLAIVEGAK